MPTEEDDKPTSLADDLRSSLDSLRGSPSDVPEETPEPAEEVAPEVPAEETLEPSPAAERARDPETGRFAPKTDAKPAVKPKEGVTRDPTPIQPVAAPKVEAKPAAPVASTAPASKAPTNWRPEVREKWAGLPADVQAEITRREREIGLGFEQAKGAKTEAEGWRQVTAPYEMMFRATGMEPRAGVAGLLQMAATLFTAPEPDKAKMLAGLVKRYGVTVESLAAALDGETPKGAPAQEFRDPRVDQLLAAQAAEKRAAAQREQESVAAEVEKMRTHPRLGEFFEDLREEAGVQMAAAATRNQPMTVEQGFERAALLVEGVRATLDGRKAKDAAAAKAAEMEKRKRASGSIRSLPAGPVEGESNPKASLREDLDMVVGRLRAG